MQSVFLSIQIFVSASLIALILLQVGGSGLGNLFGGTSAYHSQKGVEKIISILTIIFSIFYLGSSLVNAFLL
ncbi:preprotein translocase subunit SecG [Patescibacteria group bacterium]